MVLRGRVGLSPGDTEEELPEEFVKLNFCSETSLGGAVVVVMVGDVYVKNIWN